MAEEKILVVEDESIVAMDICGRLRNIGYEVVASVASGEEAIRQAQRSRPDLVLMDIKLAGDLDGIEAAELIQNRYDIPIVFLTAYSEQTTLQRAKSTEPYGYILKPFQERELHANIEIALHKHNLEKRLKESQERLHLAIEGMNGSIWDILLRQDDSSDYAVQELYSSPELNELLGVSPDTRSGDLESYMGNIISEDLDSLKQDIAEYLRSEKTRFNVEFKVRMQDESIRWRSARARIDRGVPAGGTRITGVCWDITDRKMAEEKEYHLTQVLRAIRNVNQLIVRKKDRQQLISEACDNLLETMGYKTAWIFLIDPLVVDNPEQILPPGSLHITTVANSGIGDDFKKFVDQINAGQPFTCIRNGMQHAEPVLFRPKTTECRQCPLRNYSNGSEVMITRLTYENTIYGLLAVSIANIYFNEQENKSLFKELAGDIGFAMYDIGLREKLKAANRRTEQARKHLELITDNLPAIIAHLNEANEYIYANRFFEPYFQKSKSEIVGMSRRELFGDAYCNRVQKYVRQVLKGETVQFQETIRTYEGEIRHLQVKYVPCPSSEGESGGYFVLGEDVSERIKMEREQEKLQQQLVHSQKMEALGTLAGGIAHDFNNILTPLIGFAELSLEEVAEDHEVYNNLKQILSAGNRARELVQQILSISQRSERQHKRLFIGNVIKEAMKLVRASLPSTVNIVTDIPENPGVLIGDLTKIHQIIINLCTNAKHAMREKGGSLGVKVTRTTLYEEFVESYPGVEAGEYLKLAISDTGEGISGGIKDRIFEPYFTTKKKGEGSGLGLSVVHGIVKEHGGHIEVESETGKGTTFYVYLPVLFEEEQTEETGKSSEVIPHGSGNILVVDDEPYIVDLYKKALVVLGYSVFGYTEALEALKAFKADPEKFDLIISDVTMPHKRGDQLAQEIKAIRADVPLILTTGYSEVVNAENVQEFHADRFLLKPVSWDKMAVIVNELLHRDRE